MRQVKVWEEEITIPTYRACRPETAPLFLENRAYQGSSGKVYPFPVTEKISDEKEDVTYQAVFLENEYLQVMREDYPKDFIDDEYLDMLWDEYPDER